MMEEYMKKKRMRKVVRNDNDEHEEYEKDYIEIYEESSSKIKFFVLAAILACFGYCYFGGAGYKQGLSESQADAPKQHRDAKRRGNNQAEANAEPADKPVPSSQNPAHKQDSSPEPSKSPDKQSKDPGESAETENLKSREGQAKKKPTKKK